jgi:hypothetical protein
LLRKFKNDKLERSRIFPLTLNVISIDTPLPNLQLFTDPTVAEFYSIYETKNNTDLITNECFYSDGILGNLYNIHGCDKYWLLSFCTASHFQYNFKDEIKCFVMGYNTPTLINGLSHYCYNSKFGKNTQPTLQWLGMGFDAHKVYSKEYNNNILQGFAQDDLCNRDNLSHIKRIIENKMGSINMLYNNISPESDYRILLSASVLVMTSMPVGLFISKIPIPTNWNDNFINYLLLFALLFNNTDICRFPVSTKSKEKSHSVLSFQYFLICHDRKKILHRMTSYRKILTYMKKCETVNSDILNFTDNIIESSDIQQWRTHIINIKKKYIQADQQDNPQLKLCAIIDTIKDVIGFEK